MGMRCVGCIARVGGWEDGWVCVSVCNEGMSMVGYARGEHNRVTDPSDQM